MSKVVQERDAYDLRIAGFLKRSTVNGPGVRSVIWVQGCPIRCKGCFNPGFWDYNGGETTDIGQIADEIISTAGIDGVTFSGGEPFFQADPLARLAKKVHAHNLSVVTFSGYSYDTLAGSTRASWGRLLAETDLLISGPFIEEIGREHLLAGSSNQEIRILTDRIPLPANRPERSGVDIEYTISPDGTLSVTGFPEPALRKGIAALGTGRD